jgi:hypothetical protein
MRVYEYCIRKRKERQRKKMHVCMPFIYTSTSVAFHSKIEISYFSVFFNENTSKKLHLVIFPGSYEYVLQSNKTSYFLSQPLEIV